jgi:Putative ATPase subunit of terminase (gpP-like)
MSKAPNKEPKTNREQDREDAFKIFMTGDFTQKEIAQFIKVTEATVSRWAKADDWDMKLIESMSSDTEINENAWKSIRYMMKVMARHVDENTENGTWKPIDAAIPNSLTQILKATKPKELKLVTMLDWGREFLELVRENDHALAKVVSPMMDEFINRKRKSLNDKS